MIEYSHNYLSKIVLNIAKIFNNILYSREKWYKNFLYFLKYTFIRIYLVILLIFNGIIWYSAIYIDTHIKEERIALHYNVDFGIDYYGNTNKIYIIPLLGILIILINVFLLSNISGYKDRKFIAHLLLSAALLANLILFTAIISIYLINFK